MNILKNFLKILLPKTFYYRLHTMRKNKKDYYACISLLFKPNLKGSLLKKIRLIKQLYVISDKIDCQHTQEEMLNFIEVVLNLPPNSKGVIIEAGCYKGGSTAKFSLAVDIVGKNLVVFDSFQGIPENSEAHDKDIFGGPVSFKEGYYCGTLDEVKINVSKYGKIDCCKFVKGWFENTLPNFQEPISAIYLDVDLVSSTRTCLKYFYPLLEPGGVIFSQDGHLPLVDELFDNDSFWLDEIGCKKPPIFGLGKQKLIHIIKPDILS